jgi:HlyD family secretion protein
MKKRYIWKHGVAMFLCVSLLMTGCGGKKKDSSGETQQAEAEQEQNREVDAWGEIKYRTSYQMVIDFPAIVDSIEVKEGDVVRKGDVLAVLNMDEFTKTIAKLEDQRAAGEAALEGINQNTAGVTAQIGSQRRNVEVAQTDLNHAKVLFDAGDISKTDYDKYVTNLEFQKASLKVLEVQLDQLTKNNSSNLNQQASNNSALDKELDIYKSRLNKPYLNENQIISNVENGIVKNIAVENGTILGSDSKQILVMDIIDQDSAYISAEVDEEYINEITLDSLVRIVPIMNPDLELKGSVSQIAAMAEEKDGNRIIKVWVLPDDEEKILKPGYTVDVYFADKEPEEKGR